MRWHLLTAAITAGISSACAAGEQFPYEAYINAAEVFVHSGPAEHYYPTDKLRLGEQVEVHRHESGGWYGIRPPKGSFSWVAARYLQPAEDNLAVVTEDNVSVRVGSRVSDARHTVQVRLRKGEVVELLEPQTLSTQGVPPAWCKIAPPSGEFRWVHGSHLDRQPPKLRRPASTTESPNSATDSGHAPASGKPSDRLAEEKSTESSSAVFQRELQSIEIELSVMVVEEPAVWSFDSLLHRAAKLLEQADTALDRGQAQVLINRINRFADIKQHYDHLAAMRHSVPEAAQLTASRAVSAETLGQLRAAGRFDAVGRLAEVPTRKPGAPRYALLDDQGRVRCYVTPGPGLSLRAYVGKYVGISGTRGYVPAQQAAHLMARHVRVMEDSNWR